MKTLVMILFLAAALSVVLGLISSVLCITILKGSPRGFFDLSIALSLLTLLLATANPFGKSGA